MLIRVVMTALDEYLRKVVCLLLFPHIYTKLNTQCCWQCSDEPRTGLVLVTIGGTRSKQTTQIEDMTTRKFSRRLTLQFKQTLPNFNNIEIYFRKIEIYNFDVRES